MALVAYDCSDDSDHNESEEVADTQVISNDDSVVRENLCIPTTSSVNSVPSNASAAFSLPAYRCKFD